MNEFLLMDRLQKVRNKMNDICYNINTGYDESDEFVCSNCGIQLRGWYSIEQYPDGDIEYNDYEFNFCPNCGAKIKELNR